MQTLCRIRFTNKEWMSFQTELTLKEVTELLGKKRFITIKDIYQDHHIVNTNQIIHVEYGEH